MTNYKLVNSGKRCHGLANICIELQEIIEIWDKNIGLRVWNTQK